MVTSAEEIFEKLCAPGSPVRVDSERMTQKVKAAFVEPMLLLRSSELPDGEEWLHELKWDGYRALAIKTAGKAQLRSRNDNDFSGPISIRCRGTVFGKIPKSGTRKRCRMNP